jgi:hypothetical protein
MAGCVLTVTGHVSSPPPSWPGLSRPVYLPM